MIWIPDCVELRVAFEWTCEDCGRDNFERCLSPDFSDQELEELYEEFGIDEYDTGEWGVRPQEVTCEHCDTIFKVCL